MPDPAPANWHRHPLGPDGVVAGGGPIVLQGRGDRGALLLHGFGDTPQSLTRQAHALHELGWSVRVPLLSGHGRTLDAFRASGASAWHEEARAALHALSATHERVALVGLSMGAALATSLAADRDDLAALVLLAPFLEVSLRARLLTSLWPLWALARGWIPGNREASILDPVAREQSLGYGWATPRLLRELRRVVDAGAEALPRVRIPTCLIASTHDYRVASEASRRAYERVRAPIKALSWVERSGHVITVDHDADVVTALVVEWLERHAPGRG